MAKQRPGPQPQREETAEPFDGPAIVVTVPGVYAVRLGELPRRLVDTNLPAGEAAQSVARDQYCQLLGIVRRPGQEFTVELSEG